MERSRWACVLALVGVANAQDKTPEPLPLRVAGIVQRNDGGPLADARVSLSGLAHPELPPSVAWALGAKALLTVECVTDGKGVFKVALPHAGPFALVAVSSDGKRAAHRFPVMASDFVTMPLRPPAVVEGVVYDARQQPVAGATVSGTTYSTTGTSRERHASWRLPIATTADARGAFRLEIPVSDPDCVSVGARSLRASSPTMSVVERLYRIDGQSLHGVVLTLSRSRQRRGTIVSAASGQPIAGAEIRDVEESHRVERSGADGRFTFDDEFGAQLVVLAPGHAVAVLSPGASAVVDERDGRLPVPVAPERPTPASAYVLEAGAVVRGRILAAGGGARRLLFATRAPGVAFHFAWSSTTDADGRFALREARAGAPLYGFVEVDGRFVSFLRCVPGPGPTDLGDVAVHTHRSIVGTVLAPDGKRCAGAMVMLQPAQELRVGDAMGDGMLPPMLTRITYTDRAGRFRFDGVERAPQRCAIAAGFEGFRVLHLEADKDAGNVQLEPGAQATGRVLLPDGTPAANAAVQYLRGGDAGFGGVYLFSCSDADGRFVIRGLPAGAACSGWAMTASGGAGFITTFMVTAGQESVSVTLSPHGGRL